MWIKNILPGGDPVYSFGLALPYAGRYGNVEIEPVLTRKSLKILLKLSFMLVLLCRIGQVYFQVRLLDGVKACAHKVLAQQIGRMKMTSDAVRVEVLLLCSRSAFCA